MRETARREECEHERIEEMNAFFGIKPRSSFLQCPNPIFVALLLKNKIKKHGPERCKFTQEDSRSEVDLMGAGGSGGGRWWQKVGHSGKFWGRADLLSWGRGAASGTRRVARFFKSGGKVPGQRAILAFLGTTTWKEVRETNATTWKEVRETFRGRSARRHGRRYGRGAATGRSSWRRWGWGWRTHSCALWFAGRHTTSAEEVFKAQLVGAVWWGPSGRGGGDRLGERAELTARSAT